MPRTRSRSVLSCPSLMNLRRCRAFGFAFYRVGNGETGNGKRRQWREELIQSNGGEKGIQAMAQRTVSRGIGGEEGIRTPGTLRHTRFPSVLLKPLGHLSGAAKDTSGHQASRVGRGSGRAESIGHSSPGGRQRRVRPALIPSSPPVLYRLPGLRFPFSVSPPRYPPPGALAAISFRLSQE